MSDITKAGWARMAALAILIGSVAAAVAGALPDRFSYVFLVGMGAAAAAAAELSWRQRKQTSGVALRRWPRVREVAGLLLLAKVGHLSLLGSDAIAEIKDWPYDLLDDETMLGVVVGVVAWVAATRSVVDLQRAGALATDYDPEPIGPVESLQRRFLYGGLILVAAAALDVAGFEALTNPKGSTDSGIVVPALVYFPLGLWLLGHTRRRAQEARWAHAGTTVRQDLPSRWSRIITATVALAMIVVALSLSAVLAASEVIAPTLQRLGRVGDWTYKPRPIPSGGGFSPELARADPVRVRSPSGNLETTDVVVIIAFGMLLIVLALILVLGVLVRHRHHLLREAWRRLRGWSRLSAPLRATLARVRTVILAGIARLRSWLQAMRDQRPAIPAEAGSADEGEADVAPVSSQQRPEGSARRQVILRYSEFLAIAAEALVSRQPWQTPYEYRNEIDRSLAKGSTQLATLTDLFVEARFSDHRIEAHHAATARNTLNDLTHHLKALRAKRLTLL